MALTPPHTRRIDPATAARVMSALITLAAVAGCDREKKSAPSRTATAPSTDPFKAWRADMGRVMLEDQGADMARDEGALEEVEAERYAIEVGKDYLLLSGENGGLVNLLPSLLVIEEGVPRELKFEPPSLSTREGGFWSIRARARVGEATYEWVVHGGPAPFELVTELVERTISGARGPAITLRMKGLTSAERLIERTSTWQGARRGAQAVAARFARGHSHATARSEGGRLLSIGPRTVEVPLRPGNCEALRGRSSWRIRWRLGQRELPTAQVSDAVCASPVSFELLESGHLIAALPEHASPGELVIALPPEVKNARVAGRKVTLTSPDASSPLPRLRLDLAEGAREVIELRGEEDALIFDPRRIDLLIKVAADERR